MINSRSKGAAGEREFCRWVKDTLELSYLPKRNLEQVREGGADVMDVPPFCFEVKRCQTLALRQWWIQVKKSVTDFNPVPIVAYRSNNQPWRFLISANYIGLDLGIIILEELEFKKWIKIYYSKYKEYCGES